jgi:hypothetical protein
MDYELIVDIENFIKNLDNPRKQMIARELVVNPKFFIVKMTVFNKTDLFIRNLETHETIKLSSFIKSLCNC